MTIFTKIINGEIPCYKIAEDEHHFAFLDIRPLHAGHTLVVPKKETDYIGQIGVTLWSYGLNKKTKFIVTNRKEQMAISMRSSKFKVTLSNELLQSFDELGLTYKLN